MVTAQRVSRGFHRAGFFLSGGGFSNRFGLVGRPSSREGEHCKRKTPETALRPRLFRSGTLKQSVLSKAPFGGSFRRPHSYRQPAAKSQGAGLFQFGL
jgi:hypothetical protein